MQPASPRSPSPAAGQPDQFPEPPLSTPPRSPRQVGMFCGYEVQAGHPAWQESRQGRTKRLAEEMESSLPECKALDHSAQAKRPYVPSRRSLAWMNPDFASFEHPLALAGEDDPSPDPDPPPQPLAPQEADAAMDPLARSKEGLSLGSLQAALVRERFARRYLVAPSRRHASIAQLDAGTLGQAVVKHWGGALMSDQRLDFLAHQVSHEAGLTLRESEQDLEQAMFVRGVFDATTDIPMTQRWALRVLEQAFSQAHAAHPAHPLVGRGTLRVLLRALSFGKLAEPMVPFLLDHALVTRSRLRAGDARLRWEGADLQVAVAVARSALHTQAGLFHPALVGWLARANQFSPDELSFLAAGIGTRVARKVDLPGQKDDTPPQASQARWSPEILAEWGKAFLEQATLDDARLAAACLGLASGIGYPARLLKGRGLVDSLLHKELMELAWAVGAMVAGASDPQAAAARVGQSMLRWVIRDPQATVKAEQRKEWSDMRRDTLCVYLAEAARHFDFGSLEAILVDLRKKLYGGAALSRDRAQQFLSGSLPPLPDKPACEADWERVRQRNTLMSVLTATPAPSCSTVAGPQEGGKG